MNHEHNIYNILDTWKAPIAADDLSAKILARLNTQQETKKKYTWAWAAMIIVIVMNMAVAMMVLQENKEYKSTMYNSYIETTHQELISEETTQ